MRYPQNLVDRVITEIAGSNVLPLVKILKNHKVISEFKLAEKADIEVNKARSMLYKLYHANLVEFVRKKDKKKGWYVYHWSFNKKHVNSLLSDVRRKSIEILRDRLKEERVGNFFSCEEQCTRLDFSHAADLEFRCPECGKLLDSVDNGNKIEKLEEELETAQKELKIIARI